MQWYYLDQNQSQVEAGEPELRDLRDRGVVTDKTLVWNESLSNWIPLGQALPAHPGDSAENGDDTVNPIAKPPIPNGGSSDIRVFASILAQNAGWMKFLALCNIVCGVLICLTLIGALVGWIPIWLGRMLFSAANSARDAQSTGSRFEMNDALEKVTRYLKVTAILTLLGILLSIVSAAVYFFVI